MKQWNFNFKNRKIHKIKIITAVFPKDFLYPFLRAKILISNEIKEIYDVNIF
jgi:hypothetical protein